MSFLHQLRYHLRGLFRRRNLEGEMSEEMRFHLNQRMAENIADGVAPQEASDRARRTFGGIEQIKERCRDEHRRGFLWIEQGLQDIRFTVRQLARAPGITATTVLILALGIGANTAIFTVVNALMLRTLPVREPGQLVVLDGRSGSYSLFDHLRAEAKSLAGIFAVGHVAERQMVARDFGAKDTEPLIIQEVSGDFFSVLGRTALFGRALVGDDDRAGAPEPVVVLSYAYWHSRFTGDAAVVGKSVAINGVPVTIVGVMPEDFFGVDVGIGRSIQAWCPLWLKTRFDDGLEAARLTTNAAESTWLSVIGRLRSDTSLEQARAELETIERHWLVAHGMRVSKRPFRLTPGERGISRLRGAFRRPIEVLRIIAGVALVVVCANVAGLILARGASRQRELAVRLAMGAGRWRLMRQLLTESLMLALLGGGLGLMVATWGARFLAHLMLGSALDLSMDFRVFGFAALIAIGTGLLCGLLPALRFSRLDLVTATKGDSGGSTQRINRALVVLQVTLSFVLLAGAALFIRTLQNWRSHDYGFAREQVVQFAVNTGRVRPDAAKVELHRQLLVEFEGLPGVESATISQGGLLGRVNTGGDFKIPGELGSPDAKKPSAAYLHGARRYFETKGIHLVAGRDFDQRDDQPNSPRVGVISESIARQYLVGVNPLGHLLLAQDGKPVEIVGVARDVDLPGDFRPAAGADNSKTHVIYLPYFQQPGIWDARIEFVVRTSINPRALVSTLRAAIRRIDGEADVTDLGTVADLLDGRLHSERAIAQLAGFFGSLALTLCGIGLYGLLAFTVARRTREIGVRIALGAEARNVVALILRQGLWLVVVGCVLGTIAALSLRSVIEHLLYGVSAKDPVILGSVALVLFTGATLAAWLPARRAAKVDPMVALRAE
ncbi:MAG TPA: ABC transporter permease [Opitutaceae bacterium]|nr:ABC transporter permease [Opitutaceae bacterium]